MLLLFCSPFYLISRKSLFCSNSISSVSERWDARSAAPDRSLLGVWVLLC